MSQVAPRCPRGRCSLSPRWGAKAPRQVASRSFLEDLIVTGSGVAALAGAGLSVASLLAGVSEQEAEALQQERPAIEPGAEEEESFVWSVTTVVSLIPYVNWMVWSFFSCNWMQILQHSQAWLMPALNSEASSKRRKQFAAFSACYAIPALAQAAHMRGPDAAFLGLYALCAAHAQAELTLATNVAAARKKIQELPKGKEQVLQLGESTGQRLRSFTEALDYTMSKEGREDEMPTMQQKALQDRDERTAKDLADLETETWDQQLRSRQE